MKAFAFVASLVVLSGADKPDYEAMWTKFKADYNKQYPANDDTQQKRFKIFKDNVDFIEASNDAKLSYELGVNGFADLTWDEFASTHLGYMPGNRFGNLPKVPFPNITDVADSIDWVAKGAVTKVKNQAGCGSCWAFSSTGSIEGAYFVASGKLESLSEEDLVQCDNNGDKGCQGGLMDHAFEWVSQNGICSEADYPYTSGSGVTGTCKKTCTPAVTLTGHTDVPSQDEDALKAAVSKQPVSVAIEADKRVFQLYKTGVLDDPACGTSLDHGVLVVGYGTDSDSGKDYWKVKNSWGETWGEQGYIKMVRNKNQCGISQMASYPTGVKAASGPSPSVEDVVV
jgi:C1A family cysteine protease